MHNQPKIEEIQALNGRLFATLNENERNTLQFYARQGRKFGVAISIVNEAGQAELAEARSPQQAEDILKNANSRVHVLVTS